MNRLLAYGIAGLIVCAGLQQANATLVTNGTFDTDLSGWDTTGTTTGVTWVPEAAQIGRPGTPGVAIFTQDIDIPVGTPAINISFDYQWQVNEPQFDDTFTVSFSYAGGTPELLVNEVSSDVIFNSTIPFSTTLALPGLTGGSDNGTITFNLNEVNSDVGTRIQLDNVVIAAIPEVGAVAVWSLLSGVGLVSCGRRKRTSDEEQSV